MYNYIKQFEYFLNFNIKSKMNILIFHRNFQTLEINKTTLFQKHFFPLFSELNKKPDMK